MLVENLETCPLPETLLGYASTLQCIWPQNVFYYVEEKPSNACLFRSEST